MASRAIFLLAVVSNAGREASLPWLGPPADADARFADLHIAGEPGWSERRVRSVRVVDASFDEGAPRYSGVEVYRGWEGNGLDELGDSDGLNEPQPQRERANATIAIFTDFELAAVRTVKADCRVALRIEPEALLASMPMDYAAPLSLRDPSARSAFDVILTHSPALLAAARSEPYPPRIVPLAFGKCELPVCAPRAELPPSLVPSATRITLVFSAKRWLEGHALRHDVFARFGATSLRGCGSGVDGRRWTPAERAECLASSTHTVVIENSREDWFFTEKLVDALLSRTVPIYWGASKAGAVFDMRGMHVFANVSELGSLLNGALSTPEGRAADYEAKRPFIARNARLAQHFAREPFARIVDLLVGPGGELSRLCEAPWAAAQRRQGAAGATGAGLRRVVVDAGSSVAAEEAEAEAEERRVAGVAQAREQVAAAILSAGGAGGRRGPPLPPWALRVAQSGCAPRGLVRLLLHLAPRAEQLRTGQWAALRLPFVKGNHRPHAFSGRVEAERVALATAELATGALGRALRQPCVARRDARGLRWLALAQVVEGSGGELGQVSRRGRKSGSSSGRRTDNGRASGGSEGGAKRGSVGSAASSGGSSGDASSGGSARSAASQQGSMEAPASDAAASPPAAAAPPGNSEAALKSGKKRGKRGKQAREDWRPGAVAWGIAARAVLQQPPHAGPPTSTAAATAAAGASGLSLGLAVGGVTGGADEAAARAGERLSLLVFVAIISAPRNAERRERVRAAWMRPDGGAQGGRAVLASQGICSYDEPQQSGEGGEGGEAARALLGGAGPGSGAASGGALPAAACFFVGEREPSGALLQLAHADFLANDVISLPGVLDGPGAYTALSSKVLGALRWATASSRGFSPRFVLKADDDVFVHVPLLAAHLAARERARAMQPSGSARPGGGDYLGSPRASLVDRNPKSSAYVPEWAFAERKWPPFNQGIHYALSGELARLVAQGGADGLLRAPGGIAGEDVSMALWLREAGIAPEAVEWMHYFHAGRSNDNDEPEPEVARGCACSGAPALAGGGGQGGARGPAVLGLDSPNEQLLAEELVRARAAFAAGICACDRLPPRWIANEARRLLHRENRPCEAHALFVRARSACAEDPAAGAAVALGGPRCDARFVAMLDEAVGVLSGLCQ